MKIQGAFIVTIAVVFQLLMVNNQAIDVQPATVSLKWIKNRLSELITGASAGATRRELELLKSQLLGSGIDESEAAALESEINDLLASSDFEEDFEVLSDFANLPIANYTPSAQPPVIQAQPLLNRDVCQARLTSSKIPIVNTRIEERTIPVIETTTSFSAITKTITTTQLLPSTAYFQDIVTSTAMPRIVPVTKSFVQVIPHTRLQLFTNTKWMSTVFQLLATQIDTEEEIYTITTESPIVTTSTSTQYFTSNTFAIFPSVIPSEMTVTRTIHNEIPVTVTVSRKNPSQYRHTVTETSFNKIMVTKSSTLKLVQTTTKVCKKGFFHSFKKSWFH